MLRFTLSRMCVGFVLPLAGVSLAGCGGGTPQQAAPVAQQAAPTAPMPGAGMPGPGMPGSAAMMHGGGMPGGSMPGGSMPGMPAGVVTPPENAGAHGTPAAVAPGPSSPDAAAAMAAAVGHAGPGAAVPPGAAHGAPGAAVPPGVAGAFPTGSGPTPPGAVPPAGAFPGAGHGGPGGSIAGFPGGAAAVPPGADPAAAAANGFPGAVPGAGVPGSGIPGAEGAGGTGQIPEFPKGSAEYAVQKVVLAIISGKLDGLDEVISEKARGLVAELRDGTVDPEKLIELKEQFAQPSLAGQPKNNGTSKTVNLRNPSGDTLSFTVARERGEETYKVNALTIRPGKGSRR